MEQTFNHGSNYDLEKWTPCKFCRDWSYPWRMEFQTKEGKVSIEGWFCPTCGRLLSSWEVNGWSRNVHAIFYDEASQLPGKQGNLQSKLEPILTMTIEKPKHEGENQR